MIEASPWNDWLENVQMPVECPKEPCGICEMLIEDDEWYEAECGCAWHVQCVEKGCFDEA